LQNAAQCLNASGKKLEMPDKDHLDKIAAMLNQFVGIWGAKAIANFSDSEILKAAIKNWSQATADLTDEEIRLTFVRARDTLDFPPSIAQFKKLARFIKTAMELDSADEAFEKTCADIHRSRFSFLISEWDWTHKCKEELRQEFTRCYKKYTDNLLNNCMKEETTDLLICLNVEVKHG